MAVYAKCVFIACATLAGMGRQSLAETVGVMTANMACRSGTLQMCDNCRARFEEIASAMTDGTSATYLNMPDFDNLDVIIAQELFVEEGDELLAILDKGMQAKGFTRVGLPGPNQNDMQCPDSFVPDTVQEAGSYAAELPNGGLVTWTKLKVIDIHARKWCFNVFPSYHGYTAALLQKDDVNILVFNSHFAPELPEFGETFQTFAQHIRSYQVSELKNEALWFVKMFGDQGLPYTVIFGGDSNEDALGYSNKDQPEFKCSLLSSTPRVGKFFEAIGLPDLNGQCQKGVVSDYTWHWRENDIVSRSRQAYELLDFVTVLSKSGSPVVTSQSPMTCHHFKKATPFQAKFCQDMVTGGEPLIEGELQSLSDHDPVTTTITIPDASSTSTISDSALKTLFRDTINKFNAQEAACGQETVACFMNSMCCRNPEFSFDAKPKSCYQEGSILDGVISGVCGTDSNYVEPTPSPTPSATTAAPAEDDGGSSGALIGGIVGALVGATLLAGCYYVYKQKQQATE
jgi:hypothetical protein